MPYLSPRLSSSRSCAFKSGVACLWLVLALSVFFLAFLPFAAFPADIAFIEFPQREQLQFDLPGLVGPPSVQRVEKQKVYFGLPANYEESWIESVQPMMRESSLLESIILSQSGFMILTTTDAFGFVTHYEASSGKLIIDFFHDPLGSRWQREAALFSPLPHIEDRSPAGRTAPVPPASAPYLNVPPPPHSVNHTQTQAINTLPSVQNDVTILSPEPLQSVSKLEDPQHVVTHDNGDVTAARPPLPKNTQQGIANGVSAPKGWFLVVILAAMLLVIWFAIAKQKTRSVRRWTRRKAGKHIELLLTLMMGLVVGIVLYFIIFPRL